MSRLTLWLKISNLSKVIYCSVVPFCQHLWTLLLTSIISSVLDIWRMICLFMRWCLSSFIHIRVKLTSECEVLWVFPSALVYKRQTALWQSNTMKLLLLIFSEAAQFRLSLYRKCLFTCCTGTNCWTCCLEIQHVDKMVQNEYIKQSSASHDPAETILIWWFAVQKTFLYYHHVTFFVETVIHLLQDSSMNRKFKRTELI